MDLMSSLITTGRANHSARVRRLASIWAARGHRSAPTTPSQNSTASTTSPPLFPPSKPIRVVRVDDPCGEMSLIAVRGDIHQDAIEELEHVLDDLGRGCFVHLDLGTATIHSGGVMRLLEGIADDLERRGIVLRVVGLDPQHPMLTQTL